MSGEDLDWVDFLSSSRSASVSEQSAFGYASNFASYASNFASAVNPKPESGGSEIHGAVPTPLSGPMAEKVDNISVFAGN